MSQNEEVEELDTQVDSDVATEEENEQEEVTTSDDEITYEQALAWKKSLEKANKKIVALEKWKKSEKVETVTTDSMPKTEAEYEVWAERRDFYKDNESAKAFRNKIEAMVSASDWVVDRKKAFELLSWDAEIEENRKVYAKTLVAWERTSTPWFTPITTDRYDKLSDSERASYDEKSLKVKGYIDFK